MQLFQAKKGVSLIEVLISLGLISLVISTVSLMYLTGIKGWEHSENQLEIQQNLRIAMNTLSTEIRKADIIEIYSDKIILTFFDSSTKSYGFLKDKKEIRLLESNTTVSMHIQECSFNYKEDLIIITITTEPLNGNKSYEYQLSIYTRGKEIRNYL